MFIKYLTNSIKNNPFWYILTVFCEIVLLLILFCVNGILLNTLVNNSKAWMNSNYYSIPLKKTLTTSKPEDRKLIDSIYENAGDDIDFMVLDIVTGMDSTMYYAMFPMIRVFKSYEDMVYFYKKYQETDESNLPTRQQYESGEKVVVMGNVEYNPFEEYYAEFRYSDENHILVGPDDVACTVTGYSPHIAGVDYIYGCEPDNMQIYRIEFILKNIPTKQRLEEITGFLKETFDYDSEEFVEPELQSLLDIRKNGANILLSSLMLLLIVFNITLIFKQTVERRKRDFAVYRFCGFSQRTNIVYFLGEMLILSALSVLSACIIFECAVKSALSSYYSMVEALFTPGYYFLLSLGYIAVTALLFVLCIAPSFKKSIALQLCNL